MNKFLFIGVVGFVMSCGPANNPKQESVHPNEITKNAGVNYDFTLRGLYYADQGKWKVLACDSLSPFHVKDITGKMDSIYKTKVSENAYGIEPVYIRVNGTLTIKNNDTLFSIKEVDSVQQVNFKTHCLPFEFIALGNEPFWNVQILPLVNKIIFKSPTETKEFAYKNSKIDSGKIMYESASGSEEAIKIIIEKQNCSDGMSDRQYHYSAQVILGSKMLKGCAIRKGEQLPGNP